MCIGKRLYVTRSLAIFTVSKYFDEKIPQCGSQKCAITPIPIKNSGFIFIFKI